MTVSPPDRARLPAGRGLQVERTALAWYRTGLSLAGAGLLLLRLGGVGSRLHRGWLPAVPGLATLALAAVVLAGSPTGPRVRAPGWLPPLVAGGTVLAALAGLALALTV